MTSSTEEKMAQSGGMVNAFDGAQLSELSPQTRELITRRSQVLGPAYKLFYDKPVSVVRAEGVYLYDEAGKRYLDVYNNVPSVGHCHPRVVDAVARQMAVLNTHTRYLHGSIVKYAEELVATLPASLKNVLFTCTGSEASDLAMRIAQHRTGGSGFIVTTNAYHGNTISVSSVSPSMGKHVSLGVGTRVVAAPDVYRFGQNVGEILAQAVQEAIDDMRRHGIGFAGFIADSIFSSDGILSGPPGFLKPTISVVQKAGGLYIADEVQPGFARTGEKMWGFQRHDIEPDLVVMGKPMANGFPVGGVAANPEHVEEFGRHTRYFNTFGGNPVAIAAAQAVLDIIRDEQLQANALRVGGEMTAGLQKLASQYPAMGDVRGAGLFIGVDLVKDKVTKVPDGELGLRLVNRLREKHVLISASGAKGNVLKIRPPLPFTSADCQEFLHLFGEAMAELH